MTTSEKLKETKILISEEKLRMRVVELAQKINEDYVGKSVTAICILKGGVVFFSDMIHNLKMPLKCEFVGVSSYGDETKSSGEVKLTHDTNEPLEGKHVIVFEEPDIYGQSPSNSSVTSKAKAKPQPHR